MFWFGTLIGITSATNFIGDGCHSPSGGPSACSPYFRIKNNLYHYFHLARYFFRLILCNMQFQESDDEISHLEWETVRVRFVKAGTVERLVEALATDDGELESTYVNVFLATYRYDQF